MVTRKRDGDGDGFVDDGTPLERPVIPGFDLDINGDVIKAKPKVPGGKPVPDDVAVKRGRVGNIDTPRLQARRERLISEVDDSGQFYKGGRHGFAMRAAELTVIESELVKRGDLKVSDRYTVSLKDTPEVPGWEPIDVPDGVTFRETAELGLDDAYHTDPFYPEVPILPTWVLEWAAVGGPYIQDRNTRDVSVAPQEGWQVEEVAKQAAKARADLQEAAAAALREPGQLAHHDAAWDALTRRGGSREWLSDAIRNGPLFPEEQVVLQVVRALHDRNSDPDVPTQPVSRFTDVRDGSDDPFGGTSVYGKGPAPTGVTSWFGKTEPYGHPIKHVGGRAGNTWAGDAPQSQVLGRFGDTPQELIVARDPEILDKLLGRKPDNPFATTDAPGELGGEAAPITAATEALFADLDLPGGFTADATIGKVSTRQGYDGEERQSVSVFGLFHSPKDDDLGSSGYFTADVRSGPGGKPVSVNWSDISVRPRGSGAGEALFRQVTAKADEAGLWTNVGDAHSNPASGGDPATVGAYVWAKTGLLDFSRPEDPFNERSDAVIRALRATGDKGDAKVADHLQKWADDDWTAPPGGNTWDDPAIDDPPTPKDVADTTIGRELLLGKLTRGIQWRGQRDPSNPPESRRNPFAPSETENAVELGGSAGGVTGRIETLLSNMDVDVTNVRPAPNGVDQNGVEVPAEMEVNGQFGRFDSYTADVESQRGDRYSLTLRLASFREGDRPLDGVGRWILYADDGREVDGGSTELRGGTDHAETVALLAEKLGDEVADAIAKAQQPKPPGDGVFSVEDANFRRVEHFLSQLGRGPYSWHWDYDADPYGPPDPENVDATISYRIRVSEYGELIRQGASPQDALRAVQESAAVESPELRKQWENSDWASVIDGRGYISANLRALNGEEGFGPPDPDAMRFMQLLRREFLAGVPKTPAEKMRLYRASNERDPFGGNDPFRFGFGGSEPARRASSGVTSWAFMSAPDAQLHLSGYGDFMHGEDVPFDRILGRFGGVEGEFLVADDPATVEKIDNWRPGRPFATAEPEGDSGGSADGRRTVYHLTDKAKFKLDPKKVPQDNALAIYERTTPGLYVAKDRNGVGTWVNGYGYLRPFVVELDVPEEVLADERWGGEGFIPAESFDDVEVKRVIPIDALARETYNDYGWVEGTLGSTFDDGAPVPERQFDQPYEGLPPGYRYEGPDVRDMTPEEVKRLRKGASAARKARRTEDWTVTSNPFAATEAPGELGGAAAPVEMDDTFRKVVAQRGSRVDAEQLQDAWAVAVADPDDLDAIRGALPVDQVRSWQQTYGTNAISAMRSGKGGVPPLEEVLAHNARRLTGTVPLARDNLGANGMPSAAEIVEYDPAMAKWLGITERTSFGELRTAIARRPFANLLSDPNPDPQGVRYLKMLRRAATRDLSRVGGSVELHRTNTQGTASPFDTKGGSGITSWTSDYATAAKYAKGGAETVSVRVPADRILAYDTFGIMASTGFYDFAGQDSYPLPGREVLVTSPEVLDRLDRDQFPLLPSAAAGEAPVAPVAIAAAAKRDGDGDGMVDDGTPLERPWNPLTDIATGRFAVGFKGQARRPAPAAPAKPKPAADRGPFTPTDRPGELGAQFAKGRGDCFPTAVDTARKLEAEGKSNVRVVHARPIYRGEGPGEAADGRFWHAWAEYDEQVGDHTLKVVVDRSNGGNVEVPDGLYYGMAGVNDGSVWSDWSDQPPVKRYTVTEAEVEAVKAKHWGPWGDDDPTTRNPFATTEPEGEAGGEAPEPIRVLRRPAYVNVRPEHRKVAEDAFFPGDSWSSMGVPELDTGILQWAVYGANQTGLNGLDHDDETTELLSMSASAERLLRHLGYGSFANQRLNAKLNDDEYAFHMENVWLHLTQTQDARRALSRAAHDGPSADEVHFYRFVHQWFLQQTAADGDTEPVRRYFLRSWNDPQPRMKDRRKPKPVTEDPFAPGSRWKEQGERPAAAGSGLTSWNSLDREPFGHPIQYGGMSNDDPYWEGDAPKDQILGRFGDVEDEFIIARDKATLDRLLGIEANPFSTSEPEGDSGYASSSKYPGMRPVTAEERKELRVEGRPVPPAWTDVHVATDPDASMQARGVDAKGRNQYIYSTAHTEQAAAAKYARVKELAGRMPELDAAIERDAMADPAAAATALIRHFGLRPGSTTDTKAKKKAYGATTLQARHVRQYPATGRTTLSFVGKSGVKITVSSRDPDIYRIVERWLGDKEGMVDLFPATDADVRAYIDANLGDGFKAKDLRTHLANVMALDMVSSMRRPTTQAKFKAARNKIADAVAKALGNTRAVTLSNYINPTVFAAWEGALPA